MKYLVSFRTTLKVSRYLFRALALLLWLLVALLSVFYIVNALNQKEAEIRQEFNLSSDQAQRYIQRTSDVMKELKYIAENRLTAENGILALRGRNDKTEVPDFQPLVPGLRLLHHEQHLARVAGIPRLVYALLARQLLRRLRP